MYTINIDDAHLVVEMEKSLSDVNFKSYWNSFPDTFKSNILAEFFDIYFEDLDFDLEHTMSHVFPDWFRNKIIVACMLVRS